MYFHGATSRAQVEHEGGSYEDTWLRKTTRRTVLVGFQFFNPCALIFTFHFNFKFNHFLIKYGRYSPRPNTVMVSSAKFWEEHGIFSGIVFLLSHGAFTSISA